MLELTIQRGGKRLIRQPIEDKPITIGRSSDNALRLLDAEVSRHHCRIEWSEGTLKITDLSTNGTYVNGEACKNQEIHAGDRISIGPWTLSIEAKIDAVPIKTVIDKDQVTHVTEFDQAEKRLTTEHMEFTVQTPHQANIKKRISAGEILIGHHASCNLAIADPYVSRRHCKIISSRGQLQLIDLASTNGTYVDDVRITKASLPPRGMFRIGRSSVLYSKIRRSEDISPSEKERLGDIIGTTKAMREVFTLIERVAPSDAIVCITGDSGTGKELVARQIHGLSQRKKGPFTAINCGAVPADIIESQLFGHERGAFTGALERQAGLFEQSNGGSLLLDEIGEMPLHLQTRLLRIIESGAVRRLGGKDDTPIDVRLICATNKNLKRMVSEGRFREDLFFRIYVVPIDLPPLKERLEDIAPISKHLLETLAAPGRDPKLTDAAMERLKGHAWPGNVRELKNTLMRALVMTEGDIIAAKDLKIISVETLGEDGGALKDNERSFLISTLEEEGWNLTKSAIKLGIARTTLQAKVKRYRICIPR